VSTTHEVIASLTQTRTALLEAIAGLPEARLDQKGVVDAWSLKNVLAHLDTWESAVTGFLPARLATGAKPAIFSEMTDEDAWNAKTVAARDSLTPQEQLHHLAATRAALLQLIGGLGDEALQRAHPWPEWEGTLAAYLLENIEGHEKEHLELVQAALVEGHHHR
jgi:hypothetical protein